MTRTKREAHASAGAAGHKQRASSTGTRRRIAVTEATPEPPAPPELQDEDFGLAVRLAQLIRTKKVRSPVD
jgi:hypothetical protein